MKFMFLFIFIFSFTIACLASDQASQEFTRISNENFRKRSKEMEDYQSKDKNWARSEAFVKFSIKQENDKFDDESKMFSILCKNYNRFCTADRKDERDRSRKFNIYRLIEQFKNYKLVDEKTMTNEIFKQKADEYWIDYLNFECKKFINECTNFKNFNNDYKNKFHKNYEPNKNYESDRDKAVALYL